MGRCEKVSSYEGLSSASRSVARSVECAGANNRCDPCGWRCLLAQDDTTNSIRFIVEIIKVHSSKW